MKTILSALCAAAAAAVVCLSGGCRTPAGGVARGQNAGAGAAGRVAAPPVATARESGAGQQGRYPEAADILAGIRAGYSAQDEPELARNLRRLALKAAADKTELHYEPVYEAIVAMQQNLVAEYGVPEREYFENERSVGLALFRRQAPPGLVLEVLLREARMLSPAAQAFLNSMYVYPLEGFERNDPRILGLFEELATEGWPAATYDLAGILYNGYGVPSDRGRALALMERADSVDAHLFLANHEIEAGDFDAAEAWLKKAAERDSAAAWYNLGVLDHNRGRHESAVACFKRSLELDPEHYAAMLELARMHIAGWGTERNPAAGAALMARVAAEADETDWVWALAHANMGFLYMEGNGVEQSRDKAIEHLKKAAAAGVAEARDALLDIEP